MKRSPPGETDTAAFGKALEAAPDAEHYVLRLFITGSSPKSALAIQNIRALCDEKLQGRYDLQVVDIYQHPEEVKPEQIIVTPTLLKKLPLPLRKIIGDLSDRERVLVGLDLIPLRRHSGSPEK